MYNKNATTYFLKRNSPLYFDDDGVKHYVFDANDTYGTQRFHRNIFPLKCLLEGLDVLNGTELKNSGRRDYQKILSGVARYLQDNDTIKDMANEDEITFTAREFVVLVRDKDKDSYKQENKKFTKLYNGEDIFNDHSRSDMSLMSRLVYWCNGDKEQMLRIFATSGLYRKDKSPSYYECTAIKAIRGNSGRISQIQNKPIQAVKKTGNSNGGKR